MAGFTRLRFVDRDGTAGEFFALESFNGGFSRPAVRHLHEAKAARAPGFTVSNDVDLFHSTILLEELAEVLISGSIREIANKDVHTKFLMDQC